MFLLALHFYSFTRCTVLLARFFRPSIVHTVWMTLAIASRSLSQEDSYNFLFDLLPIVSPLSLHTRELVCCIHCVATFQQSPLCLLCDRVIASVHCFTHSQRRERARYTRDGELHLHRSSGVYQSTTETIELVSSDVRSVT